MGSRGRITKIFVADFETRAGEEAERQGETWVWAWGLCSIWDQLPIVDNSIDSFFNYIMEHCQKSIIYFHNLKFDGVFIVDWLLKHGYSYYNDKRKLRGLKGFTAMISDTGVYYSLTVSFHPKKTGKWSGSKTVTIEFRDSLKKLPFSVKKIAKDFKTSVQKLDLDYVLDRKPNHTITLKEKKYIENDVLIVAEVLQTLYQDGLDKMTIGSDCLAKYKEICGGDSRFRGMFPVLETFEDTFVRKTYRGGWCYVNPKYQGKLLKERGETYDVNSLYPSMMHSVSKNRYPIGEGIYFTGDYEPSTAYDLYVKHFKASFVLKPGKLPTVQLKGNYSFRENEYITDSGGVQDIYMTCVDYELFLEHYDIIHIEHIDGYMYRSAIGLFDDYIDKFMHDKMNGEGAVREEAKLFLNNLYGKFAQKVKGCNKSPYLKDGRVAYTKEDEEERKPVYIPVGTFTTSYSRRFTIKAAQENYEVFCYADTDSIHCCGSVEGIRVHDKHLCHWKHECTWDQAIFLRQKTYMEKVDGKWELKCAGMNAESKQVFLEGMETGVYHPTDFKVGLEIKQKKLKPKVVRGGVILTLTDFKIHA